MFEQGLGQILRVWLHLIHREKRPKPLYLSHRNLMGRETCPPSPFCFARKSFEFPSESECCKHRLTHFASTIQWIPLLYSKKIDISGNNTILMQACTLYIIMYTVKHGKKPTNRLWDRIKIDKKWRKNHETYWSALIKWKWQGPIDKNQLNVICSGTERVASNVSDRSKKNEQIAAIQLVSYQVQLIFFNILFIWPLMMRALIENYAQLRPTRIRDPQPTSMLFHSRFFSLILVNSRDWIETAAANVEQYIY